MRPLLSRDPTKTSLCLFDSGLNSRFRIHFTGRATDGEGAEGSRSDAEGTLTFAGNPAHANALTLGIGDLELDGAVARQRSGVFLDGLLDGAAALPAGPNPLWVLLPFLIFRVEIYIDSGLARVHHNSAQLLLTV